MVCRIALPADRPASRPAPRVGDAVTVPDTIRIKPGQDPGRSVGEAGLLFPVSSGDLPVLPRRGGKVIVPGTGMGRPVPQGQDGCGRGDRRNEQGQQDLFHCFHLPCSDGRAPAGDVACPRTASLSTVTGSGAACMPEAGAISWRIHGPRARAPPAGAAPLERIPDCRARFEMPRTRRFRRQRPPACCFRSIAI